MIKDDLESQLGALQRYAPPPELHQRIMRGAWLQKFRRPLFMTVILFVINFAVTFWRVWLRFAENDGLYLIRILVRDFDWDMQYIGYVFKEIAGLLPASLLVSVVVNFLLLWSGYKLLALSLKRKHSDP